MAALKVSELGEYLREQRQHARLSLRQLAAAAGVSNPYLSQVERGLRKPSAEVLQQIATGLRISAEALYVRAGILEERKDHVEVRAAILADLGLTERQRRALLDIYESFRAENSRASRPDPARSPAQRSADRKARKAAKQAAGEVLAESAPDGPARAPGLHAVPVDAEDEEGTARRRRARKATTSRPETPTGTPVPRRRAPRRATAGAATPVAVAPAPAAGSPAAAESAAPPGQPAPSTPATPDD
jgi:transcriptional regulator with XRE-family HTH domain